MGLRLRGKSKEEKRIESEIRQRKAKARVQRYIEQLQSLREKVFSQGKQAAQLGDDRFLKRQAAKYLALSDRIRKAQRLLLLMEEAHLQREMVGITGDFISFAHDISQSIAEGPDLAKIAHSQVEFEKAMARAEGIDEALSVTIDMANESILASQDFSDKNIDEIMKTMQGEAEIEEKGLDERISRGLKQVEDSMRKG